MPSFRRQSPFSTRGAIFRGLHAPLSFCGMRGNAPLWEVTSSNRTRCEIEFDSEAAILSVALTRRSRDVINASATVATDRAGCVYVGFEFLDANDGLVLEVLHSGQRRHPMVKGTIRGMPAGPKSLGRLLSRRPPPLPFPFPGSRRVFAALVVIVGLAFAAYGLWYPVVDVAPMPTKPTAVRFGIAAAGILYAGLGCLLFWFFRRRYPRSLHSEELE
jgi:hypothetical protein